MPQSQIYTSSNGDDWFLCKNESGHVYVVHQPGEASGGERTYIGLGDFLSSRNVGPEHEALLQMIGSLTDRSSSAQAA